MNGTILRWGVPALLTVVGGTLAAVFTSGAAMTADLSARGQAALAAEFDWAGVSFDGRDAILTGTATDQGMIDAAREKLAALHGVRSVTPAVVLAEFVSPFPFSVEVSPAGTRLMGGVPDETAHADLLLASAAADDELRLLSGAPQRERWLAAARFALDLAARLEQGSARLDDLALSLEGRAATLQAYDQLRREVVDALPPGVTLASLDLSPPLASPYTWSARFDGQRLIIAGNMPDESFLERLKIADIAGRPVSTSLVLASGAPEGFADKAVNLLQNLLQLEYGEASISDAELRLSGAPTEADTANRIRLAMEESGAIVELEAPRVDAYAFAIDVTGGALAFSGFVPDDSLRQRLRAVSGADAGALDLARGAPERFESGVDFLLDVAARLSQGKLALDGTAITITGRAATLADFTALERELRLGAPQGLILKTADILPPLADRFTWAATKSPDGKISVAGFAPDAETQKSWPRQTTATFADQTSIADGEPEDFGNLTLAAIDLLGLLDAGEVSFDGTNWSVTGSVDTARKAFAARSAFVDSGLRDAGWSYRVELPRPVQQAALPVIAPYSWGAMKAADGTVTFTGFLPTDAFKKFLARRVGEGLRDNSALGAGAPETFIADALAGLDALLSLDEGALAFADGKWTLNGEVATVAARAAVENTLVAAVDEANWSLALRALDAAPVVSPYVWAAVKGENGRVSLSGNVTTDELRRFVAVRAGDVISDTTELGSGEPPGFMADVLAGLEALGHLQSGSVRFDGSRFNLVGVPATPADRDAALAALAAATDAGAAWRTDLAEPAAPPVEATAPVDLIEPAPEPALEPPAAEPVVAPEPEIASAPEPEAPATPEPAITPEPPVIIFSAEKARGGKIDLRGAVPADAARRYFGVVAGEVPTDNLTVSSDLPDDFINDAVAGLRTLVALESGRLSFDGRTWSLAGAAIDEPARMAALAALPSTDAFATDLTLLPPLEVCKDKVAAFAARNAILFQSGSARITPESAPALDELAGYLKACPEATVHVEGHTDADGDEQLNLALSVMRAEAVVDQLIARAVEADRLYAIGYGESLPVESNDTLAGKQANRRIAFTVLDEHL